MVSQAAVDELCEQLEEVPSIPTVVDLCLSTCVAQPTLVPRLIEYATTRCVERMELLGIDMDDNDNDGDDAASATGGLLVANGQDPPAALRQALRDVREAGRRWTSFQLLSQPEEAFSSESWQAFRRSPVLEELAALLRQGHVRAALTLWRRHVSRELAASTVSLLAALPASVPVHAYCGWLQDEVVPLLGADDCTALAGWLAQRAAAVEALDGAPHNALRVARVLWRSDAASAEATAATLRSAWVQYQLSPAQAVARAVAGISGASLASLVASRGQGGAGGQAANQTADEGLAEGACQDKPPPMQHILTPLAPNRSKHATCTCRHAAVRAGAPC